MIIHENGPTDYKPSFEEIPSISRPKHIRSATKIELNFQTLENKLQENEIDEYIRNEEMEDRLDHLIHEEEKKKRRDR